MFNVPAWHRPRYPVPPRNARSSGTSADRPLPARDERSLLLVCMKTARLRARHHHLQMSNSQAPSPRLGRAPVPFVCFRSPKNEGSRAPAGAGAERRTRWPASRSSRSPDRRRSPAGYAHRRAYRRSAAAFSLRRRAALSAALFAPPSASSWQEAIVPPGGAPPPPGCVLCVSTPAGAAPAKARNCRAPATEVSACSPAPPSIRPASRRLMKAPLNGRGISTYNG